MHAPIEERKQRRMAGNTDDVREISKSIQKEVKAVSKANKRERIDKILQEFRGLSQIAGIHNDDKREKICEMKNGAGEIQTDLLGIANALADFYEDLYFETEKMDEARITAKIDPAETPPVTVGEIKDQLRQMENGKAADGNCMVAYFSNSREMTSSSFWRTCSQT